jgi:hypothetical protein
MSERDLAYRKQMKELDAMIDERDLTIKELVLVISDIYARGLKAKTFIETIDKSITVPDLEYIITTTYKELEKR